MRPIGSRRLAVTVVLAAAWLLLLAGLATSVQAATYTVGTTKDVTGTCASPAAGTCSLRQLINYEDKLAATPNPPDTIAVPAGAYSLVSGELEITQSLSIVGAGARTTHVGVPAGVPAGRVFEVKLPAKGATPSVVISGLEISGGTAGETNGFFGGDVYNSGTLELLEDWITEGTASSGGGISNDTGTLVVERSLVSGNHASTGGGDSGGIQNHGSAVCGTTCSPGKRGVLTVDDSTVADNDARLGAGIFSWSDNGVADENQVTVIDSTIDENSTREEAGGAARGPGGGLLISTGTADVAGSILSFNSETIEGEYFPSNCSVSRSATIHSNGYNLENGTDCGFKSVGDLQETFPDFTSAEPQNNGGSTNTLGLEPTSAGVDAIPKGSPDCDATDQRGVARPQGAGCAIGAFEPIPFTIEAVEGAKFSGQLTTAGCSISGTPTIEWGDGQKSKATVTEGQIDGSHTYAEEGTYNGSVSYEDDCGTHKFPFRAKVADAPLTSSAEALSGTAGVALKATVATFKDADPAGTVSDYTVTINWGDDSSSTAGTVGVGAGSFLVTGSHTYAASGKYVVTVTIKDAGGASTTATGSAAIAVGSAFTIEAMEGVQFSGTLATAGCGGVKNATIEWGDAEKSPANVSGSTISGSHTYAKAGTFGGTLSWEDSCGVHEVAFQAKVSSASSGSGSGEGPGSGTGGGGGSSPGGNGQQGVLGATFTSLPPPVLGKTVNVEPVSGKVLIALPPTAGATVASLQALPGAAFESLSKGLHFVPLTEARQIPVDSVLETTAGVVRLETATASVNKPQFGNFGAGIFKLLQARKQKGLTELDIINAHSARQVCATLGKGAAVAAKLGGKVLGRLNANAHGKFTTKGQYSAATVRGTVWNVANQCNGTLTKVQRGIVAVRDFRRRKTITLFTGMHYLARP